MRAAFWAAAILLSAAVLFGCGRQGTSPGTRMNGRETEPGSFVAQADEGTPSLEQRTYGPATKAARLEAIEGDALEEKSEGRNLLLTFRVLVQEAGLYAFETMFLDSAGRTNIVTAGVQADLAPGAHRVAFRVPLGLLFKGHPAGQPRAFLVPGVNGARIAVEAVGNQPGPRSFSLAPLRSSFITKAYRAPPPLPIGSREEERIREANDPATPKGKFRFKFKDR